MKKKIVVTGGSGKAGRACVDDLLVHDYDVFIVDRVAPSPRKCGSIIADLSDYGQAIDALSSVDGAAHDVHAIVHLAAIPAPRLFPNAHTFRNNTLSDYNVFEAARQLGIKNIVWASSETVLGLPFDEPPPYVPVDEDYRGRPESAYSLSKLLSETMAEQYCRWDPELKIIGLRLSNVMEPQDYQKFAAFDRDATIRKWNLWGYIDARDAALAIRKSIESTLKGAEVFIIANADTVMSRPNAELLAEVFPGVPVKRPFGPHETLLSIEKARRMLGFEPQHGWRDHAVPKPV
ncbi:MAG: NAD(P)-dependent oxidoreductase [Burkholderiales bacterium]|nr:NAD(P)-dependent oxidoreductase [Phycisphaerae bacterium]